MGNKNGQQGTAFETFLTTVTSTADRITKRGVKGEADVWWFNHPADADVIVPAVAWKRLVKSKGARRVPDGERDVVIVRLSDFRNMAEVYSEGNGKVSIAIQAKATERLNVTRVLYSLTEAVRKVYGGST